MKWFSRIGVLFNFLFVVVAGGSAVAAMYNISMATDVLTALKQLTGVLACCFALTWHFMDSK